MDTAEDSRGFSEKLAADGNGPIPFPLLSDAGHRTIDAYGLQDPRYLKLKREGIPYPAVYVIDRTRRVRWSRVDQNWRDLPKNIEIRTALFSLR